MRGGTAGHQAPPQGALRCCCIERDCSTPAAFAHVSVTSQAIKRQPSAAQTGHGSKRRTMLPRLTRCALGNSSFTSLANCTSLQGRGESGWRYCTTAA